MDISSEIGAVYQRALLLRQRATESPVQPRLVEDALKELLFVLEELQTSQEELRLQNQELLAARQAIELERKNYQALFEIAPNGYLVKVMEKREYLLSPLLRLEALVTVKRHCFGCFVILLNESRLMRKSTILLTMTP